MRPAMLTTYCILPMLNVNLICPCEMRFAYYDLPNAIGLCLLQSFYQCNKQLVFTICSGIPFRIKLALPFNILQLILDFLAHLAHSAKVSFWDCALSVVRRRPSS